MHTPYMLQRPFATRAGWGSCLNRLARKLGGEVGQVRESQDGVAPVCNPSGVGVLPVPPSPSIEAGSTGGLHGVTVPGLPQGLARAFRGRGPDHVPPF